MSSAYQFSSQPKSVGARKTKYRGFPEHDAGSNNMHDPRVVRGSTYAAQIVSQSQREEEELLQRSQRMRATRKARARRKKSRNQRPVTPEPVKGRQHMESQTDDYLEELTDKPPERDETTQTEPLMDRPPSPLFMPAKTGRDVSTQIEPGDLFNFTVEVEPILEVLVGKTLEQAMDEVLEEEELANIRQHKAAFEQQRNIELAEVQRLEAEARRREAEKRRRVEQERIRVQQEEEVMEKVAARGFAKTYLNDLHHAVFDKLVATGHFFDPVEREVEETFLPWLRDQATQVLGKMAQARNLLDDLVVSVGVLANAKHEEEKERLRIQKEREAALAFLREEARKAAEEAAQAEEEEQ